MRHQQNSRTRAFALILAFALAMGPAHATELRLPGQLPAGVAWSFSVVLDPSDTFTKATASIDGKEIAAIFSNGQTSIDPFNGEQVIKVSKTDTDPNSNAGMVFFVSHMGLSAGNHTIKVVTYNDDTVVNQDQKTLQVVDIASAQEQQKTQERIEQVEETVTGLDQKISKTVNDRLSEIRDELETKVQSAESGVSSLRESVNKSIARMQTKLMQVGEIERYITGLRAKEQQDALEREKQANKPLFGSTAFISLGTISTLSPAILGIIALVGLLLVIAFFARNRESITKKISLPDFESTFGSQSERDKEALDAVLKVHGRGKWAFKKPGEDANSEEDDTEED